MRLAVYVPDSRSYPYVLTPECIQPSLACEHQYGHMHMKGVVTLDERLLSAIAHSLSPATDFENVVYSGFGIRTVEALMQRSGKSVQSSSLAAASG